MIEKIYLSDDLIDYLKKRKLEKQYKKTKKYILEGNYKQVQLKLKEPKKDKIYYFRINKQFRAICKLD